MGNGQQIEISNLNNVIGYFKRHHALRVENLYQKGSEVSLFLGDVPNASSVSADYDRQHHLTGGAATICNPSGGLCAGVKYGPNGKIKKFSWILKGKVLEELNSSQMGPKSKVPAP